MRGSDPRQRPPSRGFSGSSAPNLLLHPFVERYPVYRRVDPSVADLAYRAFIRCNLMVRRRRQRVQKRRAAGKIRWLVVSGEDGSRRRVEVSEAFGSRKFPKQKSTKRHKTTTRLECFARPADTPRKAARAPSTPTTVPWLPELRTCRNAAFRLTPALEPRGGQMFPPSMVNGAPCRRARETHRDKARPIASFLTVALAGVP
jgi:hypothetical protein